MALGKKIVKELKQKSKKDIIIIKKSIRTLIKLFEENNIETNELINVFREISKICYCSKDTNKNVQNEINNFELLIEEILIRHGFSKNIKYNVNDLKKLISGEKHNLDFNDLTYIHQPFGSHKPPDFIIFYNDKSIFVECKSGEDKPTFNTRYPKGSNIYLFFHRKKSEVVSFMGVDIMDEETIKLLNEENEEVNRIKKNTEEKFRALGKEYNKYGFSNYQRNMYCQTKSYATDDNDRITDFINNPEREKIETNIYNFVCNI
jgi:hypothetical protein